MRVLGDVTDVSDVSNGRVLGDVTPSSPTKQDFPALGIAKEGSLWDIKSRVFSQQQRDFMLNTAPQIVENELKTRPSMIKDMISDPTTLKRLEEHPLGTVLRTVGGAAELASGIPADIGLAAQKGTFKDLLSDIAKTATGQRPSNASDILRASGIPGISTQPVAQTLGMVAESVKGTPTAAVGETVFKGLEKVGELTKANVLVGAAQNFGKKVASNGIAFLTRIPKPIVDKAIDNPQYLSSSYIKNESKAVDAEWERLGPGIDYEKNTVDPKPMFEELKKANIEPRPMKFIQGDLRLAKIGKSGKDQIYNWMTQMSSWTSDNQPSLKQVRRMLLEMDDALTPTYKKISEQGGVTGMDDFQRLVPMLRYAVRSTINQNVFPEVDNLLTKSAKLYTAKNVFDKFSGINGYGLQKVAPSFFRALPIMMALKGLGMPSVAAGLTGYSTTLPPVAKLGVRAANVSWGILSEPTVVMEYIKKGAEDQMEHRKEDANTN